MFKVATHFEEVLKVWAVRHIVFVEEQKVPYALEHDSFDYSALHLLGEKDGEPFGAGRLRFIEGVAKLERIAIRPAFRGKGYGHQLTNFMIQLAQAQGFRRFKLHAQVHLSAFYQQHDFQVQGEKFVEAGIEHYLMLREDFLS
jgi:predicted GNAT family N-acyltransferase